MIRTQTKLIERVKAAGRHATENCVYRTGVNGDNLPDIEDLPAPSSKLLLFQLLIQAVLTIWKIKMH